jgi:hypothetical protein
MRKVSPRLLVACAAVVVALACGDVPTLVDGIAYISTIDLPSIAVGAGDQMRDSAGNPAPLSVRAYDKADQLIPDASVTFLVSPIDPGIHIDSKGFLTASDSVRGVRVVARVGEGLQTTEALLFVVPIPDQIVGAVTTDSLPGAPAKGALQVTVTGTHASTTLPSQGIVVNYRIVAVNGNTAIDTLSVFLVDDANNPLRNNRTAIDTTDASGIANRFVLVSDTTGIRTIEISATARPLHAETISGNPVRFLIPLKKGP